MTNDRHRGGRSLPPYVERRGRYDERPTILRTRAKQSGLKKCIPPAESILPFCVCAESGGTMIYTSTMLRTHSEGIRSDKEKWRLDIPSYPKLLNTRKDKRCHAAEAPAFSKKGVFGGMPPDNIAGGHPPHILPHRLTSTSLR